MGLLQYIEHYIASLLQPWLLKEDQRASVVVRLWFSQIILELHSLQFDCDAINSSLLTSSPLLLQSAFLDHASLTISFFRAPGIGLEFHGLHIITKLRSINDDFWSSKEKLTRDEHKRKAIFALDPPGAAVHKTAEMLSRQGQSRNILGVFITRTVLKAIRVEMHDVSLKVHSNMVNGFRYQYSLYTDCWKVDQVFSEGSGRTIGFGAAMVIVLVDLLRRAEATVCKKCMIQGFCFYLQRVPFAAGKQDNLEGKACNRGTLGKPLLVSNEILMVLKYQNTMLSELNADILETTATVNPLEVQALLLVVSQFQGVTDESHGEGSVQLRSKRGQHLWCKAVERVRGGSWKRFKHAVETRMLRQKYTQVYSHWLQEAGVLCTKEHKQRSLSQKQRQVLEGIQKDLYLMERGLPVEAVTFARCLARKMLPDVESHCTAPASISARSYSSVFDHLNPVCGALKKVWCYLLFLFCGLFELIGRFIKQVTIVGYNWIKSKYEKHALDLVRRLPIVERLFAGHFEGNSARESNSNYLGCFNKRMWTMRYAVSFHKGSFIISGSSENQAGESFKNIMETAGKVVGAAVCLMWDNIGLAYLSTAEVLRLELTCGYIQGEVMYSQNYHETADVQKVGQSFDSNRGNVVKFFSTSPAPNTDDKAKDEKPLVSFMSQGSKHSVEDLEVDGQRPFLFLALEDFQAGLSNNLGTVKCILAMGLIDCTLDRLSLLHLMFLFKQCQIILGNTRTSTEVMAATPCDSSISEIGVKYFSGMKRLMSSVSLTRQLSLSAAIECPRFQFYGFFSDLDEDSEGIPLINQEKAVLVICLGLLEATIQPAEVEQNNDKFAEPSQGPWYNMIETRTWLRKPLLPSVGFSNLVNYIDHQQIGHNLTFSIQGLTVLFQSDGSKQENSPLMEPVNLRWELSICRDHFVSPHGLTDVVSAAAGFSVSVIPLNIQLTKLDALLKATIIIWKLSRQLPLFRSMSDESLTTGSEGADRQVLSGATSTYRLASSNVQSTSAWVFYFAVSAEIKFDGVICTICYSPKSKTDNAPETTRYLKPLSEVKKRHSLEPTLDNHIDTRGNELYILCSGLTFQFSWGDGLQLSVFSELSKASIRVVNPVIESVKNSHGSYTPRTFKVKDRVSEPATVLQMDKIISELFVERLSFTLKWDSYEIFTKMDDHSPQELVESVKRNRKGWIATNLEIAKLRLTDGTLDELMVKTSSRVKQIDVLSIDIDITRNLKSLYAIAREGIIVVDAHALIKLKEEIQKLVLSVQHMFIGNGSVGEVLTSSADNIWNESLPNLRRSASTPIQRALLPVPKQGRLNSAPNRSSIVEKESSLSVFPWLMEGFSLEFRGLCLVLAQTDGLSEPACLVLDFDASAKLEGGIKGRATDCEVTQLSMYCLQLSGKHLGRLEHSIQSHAPKFGSSLSLVSDYHTDKIPNDLQRPSNSSQETSLSEDLKSNKQTALDGWDHDLTSFSNLEGVSSEKVDYIIEKLKFSCRLENVAMPSCPSVSSNGWKGSCSLSGSDIAITTSEIQLLSALFASFSGLSTSQSKSTLDTNTEQSLVSGETADCGFDVPDGSIVAVKDVHEHLYMAVEKADNHYRLIGVLHYSLVGDKALFKVKYQKHRSSKSPSWFSLISLGAKDANGEHFRVHFRPGSGLADISSINDGSWELWRMLPCKNSAKDADESIEFSSDLHRNLVYFVNQKSKQGLTLAGGAPMMVSKPGSPLKIKVLESTGLEENHCIQTQKQMPEIDAAESRKDFSMASFAIPKVDVKVGNITLTLLHGTGQGKHLLPLLRGRLEDVEAVVHLHPCKRRLMGECRIIFEYLEANNDQWSLIVQPVETEIFYRLRTAAKSQYTDQGVKLPASLFARFKRIDCLISETSLDALLFVLGVLNISGPYTMKHSPVMASSCMVENHTGMELRCSFGTKIHREVGSIAAWSKDAFLIRNLNLRRDTWPEKVASSLSVFLEKRGVALSSPIHVSLSEPSIAAVRTRLEKRQGSKKASGPLIVVEVSKQSQDGITVTVSPMIRIHNSSGLPLELRFRRPNYEGEGAIVLLEHGDVVDDSMGAFDAINLEGELKKALSSFNLGNYLLSVRPKRSSGTSPEDLSKMPVFEWSEDIKGAKANHASGFFENLQYGLRKSLKARNIATTFGSVYCGLRGSESSEEPHGVHLCIRSIRRQVPVIPISRQDKLGPTQTVVAWQEQQELVVFPTVQVYNFLDSNILMSLEGKGDDMFEKEVFIEQGEKKSLYVDLTELDFTVRIENHQITSKAVSLGDWRKTFEQITAQTPDESLKELEVGLDFGNNRQSVKLKAFRGDDGVLQVIVYTLYMLKNRSEKTILCCGAKQTKPFWVITPWNKEHKVHWPAGESGTVIQPGSKISWIERSHLVLFQMPEKGAVPTVFDVESFSGSAELSLWTHHESGAAEQFKIGLTMNLPSAEDSDPTRVITIDSRYVVVNDSDETVFVCQEGYQDDEAARVLLNPGKHFALTTRSSPRVKSINHGQAHHVGGDIVDASHTFVRFRLKENGWDWSGPVCASALGSFSLRVCRRSEALNQLQGNIGLENQLKFKFIAIHVEEDSPSLIVRLRTQLSERVPYRIENALGHASIIYYQKGLGDMSMTLEPGGLIGYAWDDLSLPHALVVRIAGTEFCHEINLDQLKPWRSFRGSKLSNVLGLQLPFQNQEEASELYNSKGGDLSGSLDSMNVGYEVCADGPHRVLRVCEKYKVLKGNNWQTHASVPSARMDFKVPVFVITLFEFAKQRNHSAVEEARVLNSRFSAIISMKMSSLLVEILRTEKHTLLQLKVQSLSVDEKWPGAPFASMLRVHNQDRFRKGETVLHMAAIVSNHASNPNHVKYSSILLQAIDVNLDEETLLKLVPFYRQSLAESTSSRQIYFERFEIHPIKIVATFLPGQLHADYSSTQEAFRTLLHSFIKLPSIRGTTVELNGVLLSHALLTFRQLVIKCAQHYSWYAMRAIYIARGSKLLPPAFASLFDDSAAASIDVFFDPSNGSIDLQGLTLGMFNLLSEALHKRGFSGTSRYIGDLERTMKTAGSNILFAILTEVSDNVLKGAETGGLNGMINGFRRGILNVSMEPSVLRSAVVKGGSSRRIKLDRIVGADESYIEGYIQAMLDTLYKQDYLRVKVVDDQVLLKNLPPNSMLIEEIMGTVKSFLVREGLLAGETSASAMQSIRRLQGENEKRLGPAVVSLCEQLFVIFAVRALRNQARLWFFPGHDNKTEEKTSGKQNDAENRLTPSAETEGVLPRQRGIKGILASFLLSSVMAYVDGRLCRHIPNTLARRVVSGFLLSFVE